MNEDYLKTILRSENNYDLNSFILNNKKTLFRQKNKSKSAKLVETSEKNRSTSDIKPQTDLYIAQSLIHGVGVFANINISKDSIIEICYCIQLEFRQKYHKDNTILNYCYAINGTDNESTNHGSKLYMLTGNGMIYNHSDKPNARWQVADQNNNKVLLIALTDILNNQEITIDYGSGYWDRFYNKI